MLFYRKSSSVVIKSSFFKTQLWNHIIKYPTPLNLNYFWNFGSLAGICLAIQLFTGIFLNMYYVSDASMAFNSVEYIMREVNYGWVFRYIHANGASIFFLVVYIHIGRALYFRSYTSSLFLWYSGIAIYALMMATAFLGYVLPWGQMSFWGATVITGILGALPVIGEFLVVWIWGDSNVSMITLYRFLVLHYVLAFAIVGLSLLHLIFLHKSGSTRPFKSNYNIEYIPFYPNFITKDSIGFLALALIFSFFVCFNPNDLGHPDNYIMANSLVTPAHIVPEWYFLPLYAVLRSIESKVLGVAVMGAIILSVALIPLYDNLKIDNPNARTITKIIFWIWVATWIALGFFGSQPLQYPYITVQRSLVCFYFVVISFFISFYNYIDKQTLKILINSK